MKMNKLKSISDCFQKIQAYGIYSLLLLLPSCMSQDAVAPKKQSVTVYMDYLGENDSLIFEKFRKEEKIRVYYKVLPKDSILSIIHAEKYNSYADLIILHGADRLQKASRMKLFSTLVSEKIETTIDKNYMAANKSWCALSKSPIVLAYDQRILHGDTISFYNEVLQPKWKGKIALQDPAQTTLKVLGNSLAGLNAKKENVFLPNLYNQTALPKTGDDLFQLKRINSGQAQLAFIELSSLVKANQSKDTLNKPMYKNIGIIFPSQTQKGSFYNVSGAGIHRYARNAENARQLLEFLSSKRAQYAFSSGRAAFPVLDGVEDDARLAKYGKFRARFVAGKAKK